MNPTTRRHPRTLAEAFPDERAHCIEVHKAGRRGDALILIVAVVVTAAWFLPPLVMRAAALIFGG